MRKIFFLGLFHEAYDDRLYYRQVDKILQHYNDVECVYIGGDSAKAPPDQQNERYRIVTLGTRRTRLERMSWYFRLLRLSAKERPTYVQASDVGELIPALMVRLSCGARVVYDSHEDWFNSEYEYSGKTVRGFLRGLRVRALEMVLIRLATYVFCTDDYLLQLYRRRRSIADRVFIFRNFTNTSLVRGHARVPEAGKTIRLVYVGGVDEFRGVAECADYVRRYNAQSNRRAASFDVYGPRCAMIDDLARKNLINYGGFVSHPEIIEMLAHYHVGVCLLGRITKFERNLPTKNFEYMSVGLPVLTSDFGNVARYLRTAAAGFCIDPANYDSFRRHLDMLRDKDVWTGCSRNGVRATSDCYDLDTEIRPYLSAFQEPSQRPLTLQRVAGAARRVLGGRPTTPMHQVVRELRRRGVKLKQCTALELFGGSGTFHTTHYASEVAALEVWEIDSKYRMTLSANLPNAEIKIVDSYQALRQCDQEYDVIVIDNPMSTYGAYCEHFDCFPAVFTVARDGCVLILNVIPEITEHDLSEYPYLFNPQQLERRRSFYGTARPEHVSFDEMVAAYQNIAAANGFEIGWYFFQQRTLVYYAVLKLNRIGTRES